MFFPLDWTMILLIPGIILAMYAQGKVQTTFHKYSKVISKRGITGAETARRILDGYGLHDVQIEMTGGQLSDHYDPRSRKVRLSNDVYRGSSLASLGVAAHEVGHAIQHDTGYAPLHIRNSIIPVTRIGSTLSFPLLLIGLFMGIPSLAQLGVLLFTGVVLFQIITLPVEFNASSRALAILDQEGFLSGEELKGTKKVLDAAALTYVAAALMAALNLLRLLIISGMLGGRRD
ncbi:MAG: peptidase [Clostridiaceae bacterium BRH_c20a]|nr:MAG: peptidase [Clostridiaceae bacterium BRH_c20a]